MTQSSGQYNYIDIHSKVLKDGFSLSVFAVFDLLLIALMFTLLSSKFVLSTGIVLDVQDRIVLPTVDESVLSKASTTESIGILNLREGGMIIYDGKIYSLETFKIFMESYKAKSEVLLVKADAGVHSQILIDVASCAKLAGFKKIQIAATPR